MERYSTERMLAQYRVMAPSMERCRRIWWRPPINYHLLADAIYWHDEIPVGIDAYSENCLRLVLRYRTTLILGSPDAQWEPYWNEAKRQFPRWIGFSRKRCRADRDVIAYYYAISEKNLAETLESVEVMKLDCLVDDSCARRVIRLYEFHATDAAELRSVIKRLVSGEQQEISVHELEFVFAIKRCRLTFAIGEWDAGVTLQEDGSYLCRLTPDTWDNVAGLIEPFMQDATGYQWLVSTPGDAAILLSVNGQW